MRWLLDTNVLLRWVQPNDPGHSVARSVVKTLVRQGDEVFITPQNLVEFRCVATRPVAGANGLGMTPGDARAEVAELEEMFALAPDIPAIYPAWRDLVDTHSVCGVQVHDARLAAVMHAHGITHLLTFNPRDSARYPHVQAIHPASVAAP